MLYFFGYRFERTIRGQPKLTDSRRQCRRRKRMRRSFAPEAYHLPRSRRSAGGWSRHWATSVGVMPKQATTYKESPAKINHQRSYKPPPPGSALILIESVELPQRPR
jgi:hypothetical protein